MTSYDDRLGTIIGLFIGVVRSPWPDKPPTAIAKQPIHEPVEIGACGMAGDEQADPRVHGGPEKAIHHYASEHMRYWQACFPEHASKFRPGCFGENISTTGLTEQTLCIGDELALGTARVQVCQGRQPCWKLNAHLGLPQLAAHFQKSGRTGWYYRVLEAGIVAIGDAITVTERPFPDWSLGQVIAARSNPRLDVAVAAELEKNEALSERWREAFSKKTDAGFCENTDERLMHV